MTNSTAAASQVTIYATTMIYAQGATLTAEQRATLVAKADRFRQITGETGKTGISVPVRDPYTLAKIGEMTYSL